MRHPLFSAAALVLVAACTPAEDAVSHGEEVGAARVSVTPRSPVLWPGDAARFVLRDASTGAILAASWIVVEGVGGTISAAGDYVAPARPGTFHVTGTSAGRSASATVTVVPRPPAEVTLAPVSATLHVGESLRFTAAVAAAADAPLSWRVATPGGGTIDGSGLYTAPPTPGDYVVLASSGAYPGAVGAATVHVVPRAAVVVTPASAWAWPGETLPLDVNVHGVFDRSVRWSVVGGPGAGTVSAAGAYTAPSSGGPFRIEAASVADPSAVATATVTLRQASITPAAVTMYPDDSTELQVASNDGVRHGTWVREPGGGWASASWPPGMQFYLAPSTPGTFHVEVGDGVRSLATAVVTVVPRPLRSISGTASGVTAPISLRLGGDGAVISADGPFAFPSRVGAGLPFAAEVAAYAGADPCLIVGGAGRMPDHDVTSVRLRCRSEAEGLAMPVQVGGHYLLAGTVLGSGGVILATNGTAHHPTLRQVDTVDFVRLVEGRPPAYVESSQREFELVMSSWPGALASSGSDAVLVAGAARRSPMESFTRFTVARFDAALAPGTETSVDWFGLTDDSAATAIAARADGWHVAVGWASNGFGERGVVGAFSTDGAWDGAFGVQGRVTLPLPRGTSSARATAVALLSDGSVVVGQDGTPGNGVASIVRVLPSGAIDPAYSPAVEEKLSGVIDLASLPDGRLYVLGRAQVPMWEPILLRLRPDGSPDPSFPPFTFAEVLGSSSCAWHGGIELDATGRVYLAGDCDVVQSATSRPRARFLARVRDDGTPDPTFGHGGAHSLSGYLWRYHHTPATASGVVVTESLSQVLHLWEVGP